MVGRGLNGGDIKCINHIIIQYFYLSSNVSFRMYFKVESKEKVFPHKIVNVLQTIHGI